MTADDTPILDQEILAELEAFGHDFVVELVNTFETQSATLLDQVTAGIAAGDSDAVHRAAHTLKGSAASVGLARSAAWAESLDDVTRTVPLDGDRAGQLLADLADSISNSLVAVRAEPEGLR